jgi:hypothetical protein
MSVSSTEARADATVARIDGRGFTSAIACVLALAACGCGGGSSSSGPATHTAGRLDETFTLPLHFDAAKTLADGPLLAVSIAGGADKIVKVDTGSRGLVVARTAIGPQATAIGQKGWIEYTSDGLILSGEYFLAPIRFHTTGSTVDTIPVRVLGVESSSCDSNYPHCTPLTDVNSMGELGVGYGNYAKASDTPTTEVNPFLELQAMQDGTARRGYIITRKAITLGLTASHEASFRPIKLPKPTGPTAGPAGLPGSWGAAPGCFALPDNGNQTHCGTILVDTGIGTMIVGLAPAQRPPTMQDTIPNGTRINIGIPTFTNPALGYTVTTGATDDPLAPQGNPAARWAQNGPFVNTGRHLLAGYDYLFDADAGHIGFLHDPA